MKVSIKIIFDPDIFRIGFDGDLQVQMSAFASSPAFASLAFDPEYLAVADACRNSEFYFLIIDRDQFLSSMVGFFESDRQLCFVILSFYGSILITSGSAL